EQNRCGLVVPFDEGSLAGALQRMAATPDRRAMGQRGRQLVASGFTWDKIARQLVAEIAEALA
ncbi:MAG: glycosyltransferase family 1 protein, partial [Deltaproteobacteria bacterium]|nr:glycosyltransferase family 1 protein [Deltaproteobacteria bacterium]